MQKKRLVILYSAAGAVALAVAYAASNMLGGGTPAKKEAVVPKGSVEILVAAKKINTGESLSQANTQWRPWPRSALLPGMIRRDRGKNTLPRLSLARTMVPLVKGEPVLESKLLFPEDGSFLSSRLAPGMRALGIPVTMVRSAGGYVRPFDRVDLLFVPKKKRSSYGDEDDLSSAELVIENVKVLAINKTSVGSQGKGGKTVKPLKKVTRAVLEVTLPQAKVLAKLVRDGRIYMALRSLADKSAKGEPKLVGRFVDMANGEDGGGMLSLTVMGRSGVATWDN